MASRFPARAAKEDGVLCVRTGVATPWVAIFDLDLGDATERGVPARFQFARHKAVGRVGGIVLAEGALGRIAGRLQVAQQRCPNLVLSVGGLRLGGHSRCDRSRLDDLKQGRGDGVVDPQPAESDATRLAVVEPATMAGIAGNVVLRARVAGDQFAAAASAAQEAGEQCIAMLGRAVMPARGEVVADHPADRLRTLPVHITLMRAGLQRQPFSARLSCGSVTRTRVPS